jgi:hypothetical protein
MLVPDTRCMKFRLVAAGVTACLASVAGAQEKGFTPRPDAATVPSYELVSIHKTAEAKVGTTINGEPDGWTAKDCTLKALISEAYGYQLGQMSDQQLEGLPAWGKTQLFAINAKVDAEDVDKLKATIRQTR